MRIIIIISLFYLYGLTAKADNLLPEASILLSSKKETDKLVMMGSTKAKKIVLSSYDKISNSNFEQNFKDINKVNVIKNTLKKCIENKCFSNLIPIWRKGKPPTKAIALAYAQMVDDLVTENLKLKYENQINNLIKKNESQNELVKLKNETNIDKIKDQFQKKIISMETENSKLKTTIEKMLINYQNQISNLKNENDTLRSNFDKAYNLVPKSKRKKLEKEIE